MTETLEQAFFADAGRTRPIDPQAPLSGVAPHPLGSSLWWVDRLWRRMVARNLRWREAQDWYDGTASTWDLADRAHRDAFGDAFRDLRANFARTVVQTTEQRLTVNGFDLWDDDAGADRAWEVWQANRLDARSSVAHIRMLTVGMCPVIVDAGPRITVEDPFAVVTEEEPGALDTAAALKLWTDDPGEWRTAVLYLPDRVEWWRSPIEGSGRPVRWERVEGRSQRNPWGVVPVVMLRNAPHASSEFGQVVPQLRLYAATLYAMATASHYAAYRQRWATGVTTEGDTDTDDGSPPSPVRTGPDTAVTSEAPDARFGTFEASDPAMFVGHLDSIRADIGIVTNTPLRLLIPPPTSTPPTGESVRFQDAPLTDKVRRIQTSAGDGWEDVMRLAFRVSGDTVRASRMDIETVWRDPELRAQAVHADMLTKYQAMGVPPRMLWRLMGFSPQQIRRMAADAAAPTDGGIA